MSLSVDTDDASSPASTSRIRVEHLCALIATRELDRREADVEAMAAFDGNDFTPAIPEGLRWRDWCDLRGEALARVLPTRILPGLRRLNDTGNAAAWKRLEPIFVEMADEPPESLGAAMILVAALDLESTEGRERARAFIDERIPTESHEVPRENHFVAALLARLVAPRPGATVLDPWMDDGSRLEAIAAHTPETRPAGFATSPRSYSIALARLLLSEAQDLSLEVGRFLDRPALTDRSHGFDCIVGVVPAGMKVEASRVPLPIPTSSVELAMLQRVALSLRGGGRAAIALPAGVMFRAGRDAAVRRWLLTEYRVERVVAFQSAWDPRVSRILYDVIVFSRDAASLSVRMSEAKGFFPGWVNLLPGSKPDIESFLSNIDASQWSVPVADLLSGDADLHPSAEQHEGASGWRSVMEKFTPHADAAPLVQLRELAEVFHGTSPAQGDLHPEPGPGRAPFVRIRDVADEGIRALTQWVGERAVDGLPGGRRLRPGDIVLTARGKEMRVATVANGAVGAVAGSGLRVIRLTRDDVAPEYLRAWLASPAVRARFESLQTGTALPNLRTDAVASLEVAVPPLAVQTRAVRAWRAERADAVQEVLRALSGDEPVDAAAFSFLDGEVVSKLLAEDRGAGTATTVAVELMLGAVPTRQTFLSPTPAGDLIEALREMAPLVVGMTEIPDGAVRSVGLLTALNLVRDKLDADVASMGAELHRLVHPIARALRRYLESELSKVQQGREFEFELVNAATMFMNRWAATVRVRNIGSVALRNIVVALDPPNGWVSASEDVRPFFGQGEALDFEFVCERISERVPRLCVQIQVMTPDGKTFGAADEFDVAEAFALAPSAENPGPLPLGPNPYVVGDPVRDVNMFFGREEMLRTIESQLASAGRSSVILLEGARRSGKTSIQFQLMERRKVADASMVRCDLQAIEGDEQGKLTAARLWRGVARDVFAQLHREGLTVLPPGAEPLNPKLNPVFAGRKALDAWFESEAPFEALESYLEEVFKALAPRRLVLILDEFDRLAEAIDAGALPLDSLGQLRALLQRRTDLCAVLTGTRAMTRLRNQLSSPLFGMGYRIHVGRLSEEDACDLITRPVAGRLAWGDEAIGEALAVSGRQPFMLQTLCARIFHDADQSGERRVGEWMVHKAAEAFAVDHEHLRTLWGYAATSRRRLILGICAQQSGQEFSPRTLDTAKSALYAAAQLALLRPRTLDAATLEAELHLHHVPVPDEGLGADLEALQQEDLLELVTNTAPRRPIVGGTRPAGVATGSGVRTTAVGGDSSELKMGAVRTPVRGGPAAAGAARAYQHYQFTLPLLAAWIRHNQDLSVLIHRALEDALEDAHDE